MKNLCLVIGSLLFFSYFASAQQPPALKSFNAERQYDGKIMVTWTLSAGFTCQDISLEYSSDSLQGFYVVYQSPGLNGSTGSDKTYQFLDASASLSGPNYYKLDLGNCGVSQAIAPSNTPYGTTGYYFTTMPVRAETQLHFRNSAGYEFAFSLYDMRGRVRQSFLTSSNLIFFEPDGLEPGIYTFTLVSLTDLYRGKIVVIR